MRSLPLRRVVAAQQYSHFVHCDIAENMSNEGLYLCGREIQNGFAHTVMTRKSEVPMLQKIANVACARSRRYAHAVHLR
jgi:hypothetical protein